VKDAIVIPPAYWITIICIKKAKKYVSSLTKYSIITNVCRGRDSFIGTITSSIWGKHISIMNPIAPLITKTEASKCHVFDVCIKSNVKQFLYFIKKILVRRKIIRYIYKNVCVCVCVCVRACMCNLRQSKCYHLKKNYIIFVKKNYS